MDAWIKSEALKAAAKVALAVTPLTACGAIVADETPANDVPAASEDELAKRRRDAGGYATDPTEAGARDAARHADAAIADASTTTVGDASDVECQTLLDTLSPDGGESFASQALPPTADVKACCGRLLTQMALAWEPDGSPPTLHGHRWDCCAVLSSDPKQPWTNAFSACTPWGPPMPPSFDPAVELARWEAA